MIKEPLSGAHQPPTPGASDARGTRHARAKLGKNPENEESDDRRWKRVYGARVGG